jgi:predicted signal transduction protein with EAL and GGDEF domain/DNA-binding response OmpR family regulator
VTGPNATILVVDDEELNRDMLGRRLRRAGFGVALACDGAEALAAIASGGIDLVLLDVMMPGMSGLEVVRRVRTGAGTAHLPIIMVTAKTQSGDVVEALDSGADDYVTKPIDFPVTLARIRTQLARRRAEVELHQREERYALAMDGANDGVWDWNVESGDIYVSPRWREIMCVEHHAPVRTRDELLATLQPDDRADVEASLDTHLSSSGGGAFEREARVSCGDRHRHVRIRGKAVREASGRAVRVVGSVSDVTTGKLADPLTGLPNRVLFDDRIARLFEHVKRAPDFRFALLFLDLDRFKIVNDSLGHLAGDRLLVTAAGRMESRLRSTDSVVRMEGADAGGHARFGHTIARFGGDEFAIILAGVRAATDATRVAERLLRAIAEPIRIGSQEVVVSASVGIALSGPDYATPEELLRDADTALHRAKSAGRGRYEVFDEAMRAEVVRVMETEADLRRAVEAREFVLHYQPIVEISTGTVAGVEALIRWQHPTRGLLLPAEFIPIAEDSGLIVPIGYWVVGEACRQVRAWIRESPDGSGPQVSINLSRRQFRVRDMVESIVRIVDSHDVPHRCLEFELTETVVMMDPDDILRGVERLKQAGFRVSIDDFGTGYSSLSTLQRLPIDRLKLDRSFLQDAGGNSETRRVMEGIMLLADFLKLEVVAEGIETTDHLARVRDMRCPLGQGFLFARPAPAGPEPPAELPCAGCTRQIEVCGK